MRRVKVTVTDLNGVVLDTTTVKIPDEQWVLTIVEGSSMAKGVVGELSLGKPEEKKKDV